MNNLLDSLSLFPICPSRIKVFCFLSVAISKSVCLSVCLSFTRFLRGFNSDAWPLISDVVV